MERTARVQRRWRYQSNDGDTAWSLQEVGYTNYCYINYHTILHYHYDASHTLCLLFQLLIIYSTNCGMYEGRGSESGWWAVHVGRETCGEAVVRRGGNKKI